jgi:hypothetical protein
VHDSTLLSAYSWLWVHRTGLCKEPFFTRTAVNTCSVLHASVTWQCCMVSEVTSPAQVMIRVQRLVLLRI